ncbi:YggS family pyridoxal phosphate-dependent enzyme [Pseudidiomarina terrestris]|uniref:Pyridoxal phosphate homeostasis protein n=1 Tax=Pseudidiomarina terrestris TaxID=2820060 RepID=A0ABT8MK19_9GAMM|nr:MULTISPECIES: YggS family pyridoxal phosphate-dependent enzyme [unclassified Pseudidiomarina]MDN7127554.1 YggS family pyridoxal phosphate-dependent enzyme [Pseudidiomarina sp. 1APR75-33.1]MDN7130300.1 YggS family pyridoxal phosphate-dependent enzyme [Pseudidiomarina sp. 1APR75-15]MDN7136223.1 YggS family pyridoxal phosphate-dependent enzyme [Pseudidiomarina sp. 1ASP75-5]
MNSIIDRLKEVRSSIESACLQSNRSPESVQLLAVSKTKPADKIRQLYQAGQRHFGENYLQEALQKQLQLTDLSDIVWHFIGPIQSNKTRDIATHFTWVQSIDRLKIARRLNEQREQHMPPLNILIQVNIDDEQSKAGIAPDQLAEFAAELQQFPQLKLRGLMTLPAANPTAEQQRQSLTAMQRLFSELKSQYPTVDTLSMGMSNDLETAIAAGSTMVRIGTALFGARDTNKE